ncbi:hypothetical protein HZB60_11595 [candidate division KSB1 bacterium]|nr:hypothetical protein [candidate division KSB1 bacterium]
MIRTRKHLLNRKHAALFTALIASVVWWTATSAVAATVGATITLVTSDLVYLDAGRSQGIEIGQPAEVRRDSATIASLEIVATADNSSSARIIEQHSAPIVGDLAFVEVPDSAAAAPELAGVENSEITEQPAPKTKSAKSKRLEKQVTGRIGVQWYSQNDRLPQNYDITQPSVVTRLRMRSLFGSGLDLSVRLRSRRNFYPDGAGSRNRTAWDHRYYELALAYRNPGSDWEFQGGRILVGSIGGIGYLDGAYLQYRLPGSLYLGSFAGSQPDLTTTEFRSDTRKGGVCLIWKSKADAHRDLSLTTAFAGEYSGSEISREFIYQQFSLSSPGGFSIYESADVNVNRGWRAETEGSSLSLANVNVNARYQAAKRIAVTAGYDSHANYRTWETRETPDSLFDDAMRRGYRTGIELGLPYHVRLDLRETLRDEPNTTKVYASTSIAAVTHGIVGGRFGLTARYDSFENRFTSGLQRSASASWTTPLRGDLTVQRGQTAYRYQSTDTKADSDWWRVALDFSLGRHWYGSSSYESYVGTNEDVARLFVETGFRF